MWECIIEGSRIAPGVENLEYDRRTGTGFQLKRRYMASPAGKRERVRESYAIPSRYKMNIKERTGKKGVAFEQ